MPYGADVDVFREFDERMSPAPRPAAHRSLEVGIPWADALRLLPSTGQDSADQRITRQPWVATNTALVCGIANADEMC